MTTQQKTRTQSPPPHAANERIAELNEIKAMHEIAGMLADHGLGLRLVAIDYLPKRYRLTSPSSQAAAAIVPEDPPEVWLGVTERTALPVALTEVARALAHVEDFPLPEERPEIAPLLDAHCHAIVAGLIGHEHIGAALRVMQKQLSMQKPGARAKMAERLWAALCVLSGPERERALDSFEHADPRLVEEVNQLTARFGMLAPATATEAERMLEGELAGA